MRNTESFLLKSLADVSNLLADELIVHFRPPMGIQTSTLFCLPLALLCFWLKATKSAGLKMKITPFYLDLLADGPASLAEEVLALKIDLLQTRVENSDSGRD